MGRAKLRMELIPKEKARIITYHKRKRGIIKKAIEFTILCNVNMVMIINPPNSNETKVWPKNPDQIKKGIASYKSKKGETGKRTYNLNDFFQDRGKKIEDELMKARKKNMEAKYPTWFDVLNILPEHQLRKFATKLEQKEHDARTRLGKPYPKLDHRHMLMNRESMTAHGYPSVDYGCNVYDNNLNHSYLSFHQQQPLVKGGNNNPYLSFHQQKALLQGGNHPYLSFHQQQGLVQGGMLSQFEPQEYDFHASNGAGSESRPPMLNKENYVPWSSRLLRYAKSRPNGKLIHNFILNGPYVKKMIPEPGNPAGYNDVIGNQVIQNVVQNPKKEEAGIQLQAEEYDLMAAAVDLDKIKEVNANCILMANLQQASTSGTQTNSTPVYDTDRSAEVHENCDDNEIFNMFTQEEQYTELLKPITESYQVP
nr:agamous-like MADS-box protein AGL82 [Tanacetum cinerariifolium]